MSFFDRLVRFADDATDFALAVFFAAFVAIGAYAAYDSYMLYVETTDDSALRFKPGYEKPAEEGAKEIVGNMVAWLTLYDTTIDYPVMQGEDNSEYLSKDPFGNYALSGSVFLDFRNSGSFDDPYSLLYAHHMDHAMMFGALDDYLKPGFLESHGEGELVVDGIRRKLRLFAVLETDATKSEVFAPTEKDDETAPFVKANSLYYEEERAPKDGETLVGLSTCKFPTTLERTIVFGALAADGEPVRNAATAAESEGRSQDKEND